MCVCMCAREKACMLKEEGSRKQGIVIKFLLRMVPPASSGKHDLRGVRYFTSLLVYVSIIGSQILRLTYVDEGLCWEEGYDWGR